MKKWLTRIWHDPVWSKVIAGALIALAVSAWGFHGAFLSGLGALGRGLSSAWDWTTADIIISRAQVIGWAAIGLLLAALTTALRYRALLQRLREPVRKLQQVVALEQLHNSLDARPAVTALAPRSAAASLKQPALMDVAKIPEGRPLTVLATQPPAAPKQRRLTAAEIKALRYLAEQDGRTIDIPVFAGRLLITKLRAEHLLSKLEEDTALIEVAGGSFWLTEEGKAYVVRKGWV
jgi:hypothetical protein